MESPDATDRWPDGLYGPIPITHELARFLRNRGVWVRHLGTSLLGLPDLGLAIEVILASGQEPVASAPTPNGLRRITLTDTELREDPRSVVRLIGREMKTIPKGRDLGSPR